MSQTQKSGTIQWRSHDHAFFTLPQKLPPEAPAACHERCDRRIEMTEPLIPVIETPRLILRGPEPDDYPDFKATFTSYRARFMGGPLNAYEAWMLYAAEIGHWHIRGFGMWMIHDK